MAVVFTYPPINKGDIQASDRLILSQMTVDGNPTRSLTINTLRQFLGAQGTVTSVGLDMPSAFNVINSPITSSGTIGVKGAGSATEFIDGTGSLQPLSSIVPSIGPGTPNTLAKFTTATTIGDSIVSVNTNRVDITGELSVSQLPVDFGASTYLFEGGGAEFLASLDMQGNRIYDLPSPTQNQDAATKKYVDDSISASSSPFNATNSSASNRIRLGATASASSSSIDGVFIGSDLTNTNNDEQINIGHNNDGAGTQNMIIGANNTQNNNGAYTVLLGTFNTANGNTSVAIGRQNTMGTSDTMCLGQDNQSSFTGGVSNAGLMNVSVGGQNQLDCDKAAVLGFANDITGSFGWTLGSGKEAVVVGSRMTMSLLGPNRSGTNRSGPRVIIATGSALNTGVEEKRNSVEYYQPEANHSGVYHPALYNSASYADDAAAAAGGVGLGELYRNGSVVQIRMS